MQKLSFKVNQWNRVKTFCTAVKSHSHLIAVIGYRCTLR